MLLTRPDQNNAPLHECSLCHVDLQSGTEDSCSVRISKKLLVVFLKYCLNWKRYAIWIMTNQTKTGKRSENAAPEFWLFSARRSSSSQTNSVAKIRCQFNHAFMFILLCRSNEVRRLLKKTRICSSEVDHTNCFMHNNRIEEPCMRIKVKFLEALDNPQGTNINRRICIVFVIWMVSLWRKPAA